MKKWVALAVTAGIMALIFLLSAQPGAQSSALSEQVAQQMHSSGAADMLVPAWFSANAYANVRKWAHIYIYLLLGASMAVTVRCWLPPWRWYRQAGLAALLCLVWAAGDEVHQYFVPGRAMLASDVAVDALGFVPGIALVFLILWLRRRFSGRGR